MLHSVRWRLVATYLLLTVLAVSLVGILTVRLIENYARDEEMASLLANAQAVATQAETMLSPTPDPGKIANLAHTAALLGDVRVRILDPQRQVLADSGAGAGDGVYAWLAPRVQTGEATANVAPFLFTLPPDASNAQQVDDWLALLDELPMDAQVTVVRRLQGTWGSRITFETESISQFLRNEQGLRPNTLRTLRQLAGALSLPPRYFPVLPEPAASIVVAPHTLTLAIGDPARPIGFVEVSGKSGFISEALAATRRALLVAGLVAALLSMAVGFLVSKGVTSPLQALAETANRMSQGDLTARAPLMGGNEIEALARQFNEMAARLQASFAAVQAERDALRRFVADASHELRTPITALKSFNELLQGSAAEDAETRAEFLAESHEQIVRLQRITASLLDLSRLDAGLTDADFSDCDAGDLIEAVASVYRPRAAAKGVQFAVQRPAEPTAIHIDRTRLELALSNLVDNAIKFTPAGGRVDIGAQRESDAVQFWVRDSGPGIPPEDQPYIFDRFYRGRGADAPGNGLGLAIVHSVVQAHGGRISVETSTAGTGFVVSIP